MQNFSIYYNLFVTNLKFALAEYLYILKKMKQKTQFFYPFSPNPCCTNVLKNDGNKSQIFFKIKTHFPHFSLHFSFT
jgi:hypothetical protein